MQWLIRYNATFHNSDLGIPALLQLSGDVLEGLQIVCLLTDIGTGSHCCSLSHTLHSSQYIYPVVPQQMVICLPVLQEVLPFAPRNLSGPAYHLQ